MKVVSIFAILLAAEPSNALLGRLFRGKSAPVVEKAKPVAPPTGPTVPPLVLDNRGLDYIFDKNQAWKKEMLKEDSQFFKKLGTTHTPDYMYIGSVDARVPPNLVMGEKPGNVFVHRNVANLVVNTDTNLMSALQYGVGYLKVKDIIVCGHYECGGVRAAENNFNHVAPLEQWLRNVRDVYRLHKEELDAITDAEARHRRLVELNVIEQCMNVFKTGIVQKTRIDTYEAGEEMTPRVHATVFDPKTGDLKRIPVDFSAYADDFTDIYGMYSLAE